MGRKNAEISFIFPHFLQDMALALQGWIRRLFMSILLETMRIRRAEVFLFDEFLMGVDQSFRSRVEEALIRFPCRDQIVLHASHDHELMLRTCPQAIWIEDGSVRQCGETA